MGSTALRDFTLRRPCRKHFEKAKHRLLDPHVGHRDMLPGPASDVGCPSWGGASGRRPGVSPSRVVGGPQPSDDQWQQG